MRDGGSGGGRERWREREREKGRGREGWRDKESGRLLKNAINHLSSIEYLLTSHSWNDCDNPNKCNYRFKKSPVV